MNDIELKQALKDYPAIDRAYRIYNWSKGNKFGPFKIAITPTDRCNLACKFCPNYVSRKSGRFKQEDELSKEEWQKIVREGLEIGVRQYLILGGGEPMIRGETILDILRIIKGVDCELFTNGTLFEPEEIEEIVKLGLQRIIISIHGLEKVYDDLTEYKGAFEKLKNNLMLLKKIKAEIGTDKPRVLVNIVINNKNFREILEIIEFVGELGCNELAFHPMRGYEETIPVINELELSLEDIEELRKNYSKAKSLAEKYKINLTTEPIESDLNATKDNNPSILTSNKNGPGKFLDLRCLEPWYSMVINSDGRVGRCTAYITRSEPFNVREKSLKEIWFSDFFDNVRKNIFEGKTMEGCQRCGLLTTTAELKKHFNFYLQFVENKIDINQLIKSIRGW